MFTFIIVVLSIGVLMSVLVTYANSGRQGLIKYTTVCISLFELIKSVHQPSVRAEIVQSFKEFAVSTITVLFWLFLPAILTISLSVYPLIYVYYKVTGSTYFESTKSLICKRNIK